MPYPPRPFNFRLIDAFREAAAAGDPATDGPPHIPGGRPKGSKRPHSNATVAAVRRLIEETTLSHTEIRARTGVTTGTISKWRRDGGWQRPLFAPMANDTLPTPRARHRLKRRLLGSRLHALAEHTADELSHSATVDLDRLTGAIQVMKMARLEYTHTPRRRRAPGEPAPAAPAWIDHDTAIRTALKEMRRGGVDLDRVPAEAMALLEDAHTPLERDDVALRARGKRRSV
jgi:hypothetical protein